MLIVCSLAPFISNARPLTMVTSGSRSWPLLSALTQLDILWLTALPAVILGLLWHRLHTRRAGIGALCVLAIGLITMALHDPHLDPRRYHQEADLRERLIEIDNRLLGTGTYQLDALRELALEVSAVKAISIAIEDRIIAIEDELPRTALIALVEENRAARDDLRGAVFTLNPHSPDQSRTQSRNLTWKQSDDHVLGTDPRGRDLLAVLIHGTRTAFTIAVPVVLITMLIGLLVGGIAGLRGGMTDGVLSRLIELVMCLPVLVLLVLFASWLPQGPGAMIVILSCVFWTHPARLVRAEARRVAQEDFVSASRALGASTWHILRTHIIPHSLPPLIVSASFTLGWAIMVESSLSFLGLGEAGNASWGELLMLARRDLGEAPHTALWAGAALFAIVCSANVLGERATRSVR
jgi:ABC-type dipeptide/oligopeptide/nickel transport system permease subunit